MARVRNAVRGMLYSDDAGIVTKSTQGLAKMMTVIVTAFEGAGLTVMETKTDTMLPRTQEDQTPLAPPLVIEAVGQRYKQTAKFSHTMYMGGIIHENAVLSLKIDQRIRLVRSCLKRVAPGLCDRMAGPLIFKGRGD